MRTTKSSHSVVIFLLFLLLLAPYSTVSARSVHQTNTVEIFPEGDFTQPSNWTLGAFTSFSEDPATYTDAMVADQRLTMVHHRPLNQDSMTFWAQSSPTDSNNSIGTPDGATSWSTGPEIQLSSFNAFGSTDYEVLGVAVVVAFSVPDQLYQDSVRISLNYDGQYESLTTFSHTQTGLDYLTNTWSYNVSDLTSWDWNIIQNSVITLDYVSVGSTDDSQLNVDAVGIEVVMQTPWYGGEYGSAQAQFTGHAMPVIGLDLMSGTSDNMALAECGLQSSVSGSSGIWTSEIIETPPNQRIGRVHYTLENESLDDVVLEYSFSDDGVSFSDFAPMDEHLLLPDHSFTQLRISTIDACIATFTVDVNDPTLSLQGRIFGDVDGLDSVYSRWLLFVNDELVTNQPVALSPALALSFPIGKHMSAGDTSVKVELKTWFTWDSLGNASTTALEVTSMTVTGGYDVDWDEDPMCLPVGDQFLTEDGGGRILPFLYRCTDDRTAYENLQVSFSNSNPDLVVVDLTEGDIRLSLQSESSGQATIQTTVTDAAGNTWVETFIANVQNIDDTPILQEFQSLVPVELSIPTEIPFDYSDIDSSGLTASSNRSWVTVDVFNKTLTVNAPTPGFSSVLISLCDQTSCHERILDLEVLALPDLYVEEIDIGDDIIRSGDIVSIRVLVRNIGQAEASMISVRCEANSELIDFETLPSLQPGTVAYVTCDWRVPDGKEQIQIRAIIDRGLEIKEGQEDNNEGLLAVVIEPALTSDNLNSNSGQISDGVFVGLTAFAILAIGGIFIFLTPAKIKKLE
ncbi:MAG: hypothetical protein NLN65_04460 [Candidatus Poseidoniaceae archaeon]|nr:hypothetical protein [Candidatus Poseidoniaceae archaeon]